MREFDCSVHIVLPLMGSYVAAMQVDPLDSNRVIIAGGSGFVGSALAKVLVAKGYQVIVLSRSADRHNALIGAADHIGFVQWDGKTPGDWAHHLEGARAVINLAGKNVNCRYTPGALREIDESRVNAVRAIGAAINSCRVPPRVLVQAATMAIYGDAGDQPLDESAPLGQGVPPATAKKWEQAFDSLPTPATRRVLLRISFALARDGGALRMLSALTRCFLGGAVGSGRQYISWIHIDDLCRLFVWCIENETAQGLYNATAPKPVTNAQFMAELRRALHRPWSPRAPGWLVHIGCFLMRTEPVLALTGRRGIPTRLLAEGFTFEHPSLPETLRNLLA